MGRLIKTFPDGHVALAHNYVHAPGYSLYAADYTVAGHVQDGWYYEPDNIEPEDLAQAWIQPEGPEFVYELGAIVAHNGMRWRSTIKNNVWEPGVSGWRDADEDIPSWLQPTGAHDSYSLDALVKHNGFIWKSLLDNNVWEPGVSNWRKAVIVPPSGVPPLPDWVQPTGAVDSYPIDAEVRHNGKNWKSLYDNNVWEPGVFGWEEIL
jgi:hypothetical protein